MEQVLRAAKIAAFVTLAVCLGMLARLFWIVPELIKTEMAATRSLIDTRITSLETTTNQQLTDWRTLTDRQLTDVRNMADRRIGSLEQTMNARLTYLEEETMKQVNALVTSADKNLTSVAGGVNDLTKSYAALPDRVNVSLKPYTDCTENDFCWQNLVTDSMVAFRASSRDTSATMQGISLTLPKIAGDIHASTNAFAVQFPVIAKNTTNITANIDRLTRPRWYDRLIGYGLNGSMLWFNLNRSIFPSVNVVTK